VLPPIVALREIVDGDVGVSPLMGACTSVTSSRFSGIAATKIVEA
jgi:hypothetical protein